MVTKMALFFVALVSFALASPMKLQNDTTADQVMIAEGIHTRYAVVVPAGTSVDVEVGEVWFEIHEFVYGVVAGMCAVVPFVLWGATRKIFQEAE